MYYALIYFKSVPKLGFAHHFYAENYNYTRKKFENSLEIVYIKQGNLNIKLNDETMIAEPGSVFILLRTLPFIFSTDKNAYHTHSTVQIISNFEFEIVKEKDKIPKDFPGLILPFITPPCKENELIKKKLYSIISELSVSRDLNTFTASLSTMGILETLSNNFKKTFMKEIERPSLLSYKIKQYISEHLSESITLTDISEKLGKTSIYLNSVFKETSGITINQYINREKIRLITELMDNKGLSFKNACKNAGISDISYGYRVFKKQMGITPGKYRSSIHFDNNINSSSKIDF